MKIMKLEKLAFKNKIRDRNIKPKVSKYLGHKLKLLPMSLIVKNGTENKNRIHQKEKSEKFNEWLPLLTL